MYVVIVYDAGPEDGQNLRRLLVTRLHRIQNSVWAGETNKTEWRDLDRVLKENSGNANVQAWLFDKPPRIHRFGGQGDEESTFL